MFYLYSLFFIIAVLPILALVFDGYEKKNTSKGFKYAAGFVLTTLLTLFFLVQFKMYFICAVPLLIFVFIIGAKHKN